MSADQERGLLLGLATGNMLGIPVEGWPRELIQRHYPDGLVSIRGKAGVADDDDLAQALIIAEAAALGPLSVTALGYELWQWAECNGRGIGSLTLDTLTLYGGQRPLLRKQVGGCDYREPGGLAITEAAEQAWQGNRAGNGALMRCAPLAIRWQASPQMLDRESLQSARATHWDPRCGWSCVALNRALAQLLRGERVDEAALTVGAPRSVRQAVQEAAEQPLPVLDGPDMGHTLLTLRAGLWALWHAEDLVSGLLTVVETGGDTDTNGAVAGAVLGARFGWQAIPRRWREQVRTVRRGQPELEMYLDLLTAARAEIHS